MVCKEKIDLGVIITKELKPFKQCTQVEKKAQIKHQFTTRKKDILTLYNALVTPYFDYGVQFWSPPLRKDIERLEKVQARTTKLIPSIRHISYN